MQIEGGIDPRLLEVLKQLEGSLQRVDKTFGALDKTLQNTETSYRDLTNVLKNLSKQLSQFDRESSDAARSAQELNVGASALKALSDAAASLDKSAVGTLNQFSNAIRAFGDAINAFSAAKKTDGLDAFNKSITSLANSLKKLTGKEVSAKALKDFAAELTQISIFARTVAANSSTESLETTQYVLTTFVNTFNRISRLRGQVGSAVSLFNQLGTIFQTLQEFSFKDSVRMSINSLANFIKAINKLPEDIKDLNLRVVGSGLENDISVISTLIKAIDRVNQATVDSAVAQRTISSINALSDFITAVLRVTRMVRAGRGEAAIGEEVLNIFDYVPKIFDKIASIQKDFRGVPIDSEAFANRIKSVQVITNFLDQFIRLGSKQLDIRLVGEQGALTKNPLLIALAQIVSFIGKVNEEFDKNKIEGSERAFANLAVAGRFISDFLKVVRFLNSGLQGEQQTLDSDKLSDYAQKVLKSLVSAYESVKEEARKLENFEEVNRYLRVVVAFPNLLLKLNKVLTGFSQEDVSARSRTFFDGMFKVFDVYAEKAAELSQKLKDISRSANLQNFEPVIKALTGSTSAMIQLVNVVNSLPDAQISTDQLKTRIDNVKNLVAPLGQLLDALEPLAKSGAADLDVQKLINSVGYLSSSWEQLKGFIANLTPVEYDQQKFTQTLSTVKTFVTELRTIAGGLDLPDTPDEKAVSIPKLIQMWTSVINSIKRISQGLDIDVEDTNQKIQSFTSPIQTLVTTMNELFKVTTDTKLGEKVQLSANLASLWRSVTRVIKEIPNTAGVDTNRAKKTLEDVNAVILDLYNTLFNKSIKDSVKDYALGRDIPNQVVALARLMSSYSLIMRTVAQLSKVNLAEVNQDDFNKLIEVTKAVVKKVGELNSQIVNAVFFDTRKVRESVSVAVSIIQAVPKIEEALASISRSKSTMPYRLLRISGIDAVIRIAAYITRRMAGLAGGMKRVDPEKFTALGEATQSLGRLGKAIPSLLRTAENLPTNIFSLGFRLVRMFAIYRTVVNLMRPVAMRFSGRKIEEGTKSIARIAQALSRLIRYGQSDLESLKNVRKALQEVTNLSDVVDQIPNRRGTRVRDWPIVSQSGRYTAAINTMRLSTMTFDVALLKLTDRAFKAGAAIFQGIAQPLQSLSQTALQAGRTLLDNFNPTKFITSSSGQLALEYDDIIKQFKVFAPNTPIDELVKFATEIGIKYPLSINESLAAVLDLSKAGLDFADIVGVLPTAAQLASISDSKSIENATGTLIAAVRGVKMITEDLPSAFKPEAVERIGDIIFRVANSTTATVDSLRDGLRDAIPAANNFGQTFEQAAAVLGIFNDAQIDSTRAGYLFRAMLTGIYRKEARKVFDELGIALVTPEGKLRALNEIIREMSDVFSTMSEAQRLSYVQRIGDVFAQQGLSILLARRGFDDLLEKTREGQKLEEASNIILESFKGRLLQLKSAFDALRTTVFVPILNEFMLPIVNTARQIVSAFLELPDPIKRAFGQLLVFGSVTTTITGAMLLFGGALLKIAAVAATVGAVVTGLSVFIKGAVFGLLSYIKITERVVDASSETGETTTRTVTLLEKLASTLKNLSAEGILTTLETLRARFHGLSDAVGQLLEDVGNLFNVDKYVDSTISLDKLRKSISAVFFEITAIIARRVPFSLTEALLEFDQGRIINGFREFFSAVIGEALFRLNNNQALTESLMRVVSNLLNPLNLPLLISQLLGLDQISEVLTQLRDIFNTTFVGITASILAALGNLNMVSIAVRNLGTSGIDFIVFFQGIAAVVSQTVGLIIDFARTVVQAIIGIDQALESNVGASLTRVFRTIGEILLFIANNVLKPLRQLVVNLLPILAQVVRSIKTLLEPLVEFVVLTGASILQFFNNLYNALKNLFNGLITFEEFLDALGDIVSRGLENTIYIIANLFYRLRAALKTVFEQIAQAFNVYVDELTENGTKSLLEGIASAVFQFLSRLGLVVRTVVAAVFDQLSMLFGSEGLYYIGVAIKSLDIKALAKGLLTLASELVKALFLLFETALQTAFNLLASDEKTTSLFGKIFNTILEKSLPFTQIAILFYVKKVLFTYIVSVLTPIVTKLIATIKAFALATLAEITAFGKAVVGVLTRVLTFLRTLFLTTLFGRLALITLILGAVSTLTIELTRVSNAADGAALSTLKSLRSKLAELVNFIRKMVTLTVSWAIDKLLVFAGLTFKIVKGIADLTIYVVTSILQPIGRLVVGLLIPPLQVLIDIIDVIVRNLPEIIGFVGVLKGVGEVAARIGVPFSRLSGVMAFLIGIFSRFGNIAGRVGAFITGVFKGVFGKFALALTKLTAVIVIIDALAESMKVAFTDNILSGIIEFFLKIGEAVFNAIGLGHVAAEARKNAEMLKAILNDLVYYIGRSIEGVFSFLAVSLAVFASEVVSTIDRLRGLDPTMFDQVLQRTNNLVVELKRVGNEAGNTTEKMRKLFEFTASLGQLRTMNEQLANQIVSANAGDLIKFVESFYRDVRNSPALLQSLGGQLAVDNVASLAISLGDYLSLLKSSMLTVETKFTLISDIAKQAADSNQRLGESFKGVFSRFLSALDTTTVEALKKNDRIRKVIVDTANQLINENSASLDDLKEILEQFEITVSRSRFITKEAAVAVETLRDAVQGLNEAAVTDAIDRFRESLQGVASDSDEARKAVEELTRAIQQDLRAEARNLFAQLDQAVIEGTIKEADYVPRARVLRQTLIRQANENLQTVRKELFDNLRQNKITIEQFERGMADNTKSYEEAIDEINNLADIALQVTRRLRRGEISQEEAIAEANRIIQERRRARDAARNKLIEETKNDDLLPTAPIMEGLEQVGIAVEDLEKEIKSAQKDVERLQRDYEKTLDKIAKDQEKHLLDMQRAEEDYQRDRERRLEDHQNKLLDIEEKSRDQLIDAVSERDSAAAQNAIKNRAKQLEQERKNFAEERRRREEDFELQKRRRIEDYEARRAERLEEAAERRAELEARRAELATLMAQRSSAIQRETQEKEEAAKKAVQIARLMGDQTIGEFVRMARGVVDAIKGAASGSDSKATTVLNLLNVGKRLKDFISSFVDIDTPIQQALDALKAKVAQRLEPAINLGLSIKNVVDSLLDKLGVQRVNLSQAQESVQYLAQLFATVADASKRIDNTLSQLRSRQITPQQSLQNIVQIVANAVQSVLDAVGQANAINQLISRMNSAISNLPPNIRPAQTPVQRGTFYPQERWSQFRSGMIVPRAAGGSVLDSRLYRVGEFEPELFRQGNRLYLIPGQNGRIEPPRSLKSRFGSVYNNTSSVQLDLGGITINAPNMANPQEIAVEVERTVIPKITKAIRESRA